MVLCYECKKWAYTDTRPAPNGTMVGETRNLKENVTRGLERVDDSLTQSMVPGYLEPLMVEGRIGNKLDLLALTSFMTPEILLKEGMLRVQEWWEAGDRGR